MNNSLCLRQANVCSSTSGVVNSIQHALSGKCLASSAPVRLSRLDRFNRNRPLPKCKAVRCLNGSGNEVLGTRVLARREHFGRGLGLGRTGRNGSMWSAGTWLDNKASVDTDISVAEAWELWNDREKIPRWMRWIDKVTVSKQKPDFSKWTLRYRAFNRDFEFSWLARNMKPIHHKMIHWRSVDGLPNRGAVRFYPQGPNACRIELTISYELPDIMAPLGTAVGPIVESVIKNDLNRFSKLSKSKQLARV